jgi:ATPase subunit of ABC transporter with duplicated ATPase domains
MLTVSQLSKSFSGRILFDDVSLQVNRGDRIGLVGPNGAGKSTLFSLILGEVSPDTGQITIEKSATIGFLPQETAAAKDELPSVEVAQRKDAFSFHASVPDRDICNQNFFSGGMGGHSLVASVSHTDL